MRIFFLNGPDKKAKENISKTKHKTQFGLMHIFFLNGPDKKAKENISKTKQHSQQQEAKSVRQQTAISEQDVFWCIVTGTLH